MQNTQNQERSKCKNCNIFYANEAFNGCCSKCYKETSSNSKEKQNQEVKTSVSVEDRELVEEFAGLSMKTEQKAIQVDKKRCFNCKKKVGLLGIQCKCGYVYCNAHRLPETHTCDFDHKQFLSTKLKQKLNKVSNGKISQI